MEGTARDSEGRRPHLCFVARGGAEGKGGLATYMRELGAGLQGAGWEVSAAVRFRAETPRECEYHMTEDGSDSAAADSAPFATRVVAPRGAFVPVLRRLTSLLTRPALRPIALSAFHSAYARSLRAAIPASVTHLHYVGTGWELLGEVALREARRRRIPLSCHPAVHPGAWGDSPLDIDFYARVDAVLAQSLYEKQYLADRGVPAGKISVYGLGAPSAPPSGNGTAFRDRHGIGARPMVLFVGRRQRYKGYHALAEAMTLVHERLPDVVLACVGPWGEPPYPELSDGTLLDLGRASDEEKEDALAACDVFCLPSTDESFGLVYVEAWRYGKPVVAGPAPAVRELVLDGVNGYRVAQEPQDIAAALIRLLSDPGLRDALGRAGRELQQRQYTWEQTVQSYIRAVGEVARRQGTGSPDTSRVIPGADVF